MLSAEEQQSLLDVEGEEVLEIEFRKCTAGDVFMAKNKLGDAFLFELTVPISRRANVYKVKKGGNLSICDSFCGNFHFLYSVIRFESVIFGGENTLRLVELKKVRSA